MYQTRYPQNFPPPTRRIRGGEYSSLHPVVSIPYFRPTEVNTSLSCGFNYVPIGCLWVFLFSNSREILIQAEPQSLFQYTTLSSFEISCIMRLQTTTETSCFTWGTSPSDINPQRMPG